MNPPPFLIAILLLAAILFPNLVRSQVTEPNPFDIIGEQIEEAAPSGEESDEAGAPEPLSAQISQHILKLAEGERDKRLKFMAVVIDDVARLCQLDSGQQEQLKLAAKGAAERSMKDWHTQAERYFRTRLDGADRDTTKEMLEGMGSVNFGGNRSEEEGESLDLWKDTLKTVLSDEQIQRYEEVLEQRQLDRIEAFTLMSVTTLDSHLRFTPEQKEEIEELVHEATTAYLDDVQRYWGDYFERGMLMSLANASEESELREILTDEQFDRLKEATTNFDHFWDQKRRLKRAKEKAALRRAEQKEEDAKKEDGEAEDAAGSGLQ
ncbi:MAG: hypothetical protein AAGF67_02060 [Verrucomicrobiota bacterium]